MLCELIAQAGTLLSWSASASHEGHSAGIAWSSSKYGAMPACCVSLMYKQAPSCHDQHLPPTKFTVQGLHEVVVSMAPCLHAVWANVQAGTLLSWLASASHKGHGAGIARNKYGAMQQCEHNVRACTLLSWSHAVEGLTNPRLPCRQ